MAENGVQVVFMVEMAETHHGRATLPAGWKSVGINEFQIIYALGWKAPSCSLQKVWPDAPANHKTKSWRAYLQAASRASSSAASVVAVGAARTAAAGGRRGYYCCCCCYYHCYFDFYFYFYSYSYSYFYFYF